MERRHFLKIAAGMAAGAAALAASATAAPLPPVASQPRAAMPHGVTIDPAVVTQDDVDHLTPEPVRWGWRRRWHWHRRHWGWRHHWHRGWHWRRRWHRRYW